VDVFAVRWDVAGPGLFAALGAGAAGIVLGSLLIVFVEALVLRFMGWGPFGPALLTAFLMNLVSGLAGLLYAPLVLQINGIVWVIGAFILSVLIEGGVVALQRKVPYSRALWPVLVSNIVTYIPIAVLILAGVAFLGA
jgi:hypothetical protein